MSQDPLDALTSADGDTQDSDLAEIYCEYVRRIEARGTTGMDPAAEKPVSRAPHTRSTWPIATLQSASTKQRTSPVAAAAPSLRTPAMVVACDTKTFAPAACASSTVSSREPLSTTCF